MNPLSSLFIALCVGAAILLAGYFVLGLHRRGRLETTAGISLLNALKWREFADLAGTYFERQGYTQPHRNRRAGEGGFDLLLERDGEQHIAVLKLSSAYEYSGESVRELGSIMATAHAKQGYVLTTGNVTRDADALAERQNVTLLHDESLWHALAPLMPTASVHDAIESAHRYWQQRLTLLGATSVVAVIVLFLGLNFSGSTGSTAAKPVATKPTAATPAEPAGGEAQAPDDLPLAGSAIDPKVVAQNRQRVLEESSTVNGVVSVGWSSDSTMVLGLNGGSAENRARIIEQVCANLLKRPELALSRLQIHDFQPATPEDARVHWQQCK